MTMSTNQIKPTFQQKTYHKAVTQRGQGNRNPLKYNPHEINCYRMGFRLSDQTLWILFGSHKVYSATGYDLLRWQQAVNSGNPFSLLTTHIRKLTHSHTQYTRQMFFAEDCDFVWINPAG